MNHLPETPSLGTPHAASTAEDLPWIPAPWHPDPSMPTQETPPPRMTAVRLTPRELEVAAWLGEDITCEGIARRLGIVRETVRAHLRNIGKKLGVHSRHAMVARLATRGITVTNPGS